MHRRVVDDDVVVVEVEDAGRATAGRRPPRSRRDGERRPSPRGGERAVEQARRVPPAVGRVQQHRQHAHAVALGERHQAVAGALGVAGLQADRAGDSARAARWCCAARSCARRPACWMRSALQAREAQVLVVAASPPRRGARGRRRSCTGPSRSWPQGSAKRVLAMPSAAARVVHRRDEALRAGRQVLGERAAGVVRRAHHRRREQVARAQALARLEADARTGRLQHAAADGHGLIEPAALEREQRGHHLGQARRRQPRRSAEPAHSNYAVTLDQVGGGDPRERVFDPSIEQKRPRRHTTKATARTEPQHLSAEQPLELVHALADALLPPYRWPSPWRSAAAAPGFWRPSAAK